MILWTIQPGEVWDLIQQTGVYRCNPVLSSMPEPEFAEKYQWLINQMIRRIGPPPEGVSYPVWAWHTQNGKRKKPDLRSERWGNGPGGENYVCIELEVPDDQVLLSDFNDWSLILCNGLLADSEAEADRLDAYYETLAPDAQISFRDRNWEKAFDTAPFNNGWTIRGECIQATFWELRKEMIRDVRFFVTGKKKTGYGMTGDPNVFAIRWIFLTDSQDTELYLYLNGENILAFERSGRELTTRWNLDELTAWLRAFLDHMQEDPYPVEAAGEYAAQKDDTARDFETDDEDEMEAYYGQLYEWNLRHRWHTASSGAILADVFFQLAGNQVEISWDNRDMDEGVHSTSVTGVARVPRNVFTAIVDSFLRSYDQYWS